MDYPIPERESERLEALRRCEILDTPPEASFDRITRIVQTVLGVPIALVSLVDENRQWFKSKQGLAATETSRDVAFCAHAITGTEVLVIPDARGDDRFNRNPLVTGPPNIRFYAGAPLRTKDGFALGTLCAIDDRPRQIGKEDIDLLSDLAQLVVDEFDLRNACRLLDGEILSRALAEQNARDNAARARAIVDTVVDGIITIDADGRIETFNPAAEQIFGYVADEVIGKNVKILMPERYGSEHDRYIRHYVDTKQARIIGSGRAVTGQRQDGTNFPMELAVGPMQVAGKLMFTGIVRDITERQQIENMKNEFVSTVSHELRTPLTSIQGSLGLIRGGVMGEMPDKFKKMIDIAYNNSDRLVRMVNDILDIEKIESGKMEFELGVLNITSLLEEAIDINRGYAERYEVSLELQGERPELLVNGCRDRLMQVLTNLLSNAVKYSPVGGTVFASACCQNDVVRVSVVDHGPGIPEEFSEDLFAKFTRVDGSDARQKCGTGLGLSISKAIVEQHGGRIGYDTEDGRGTRFFFDLPERRQEIDVASQEADAIVDEQSDPPRILVCAEDQDIATLLGMMLERSGYAFDIAQDARQAKASLRRSVYAAMTLDLVLPDQDGISLIRELRQRPETADLPIIVVSANTERGTGELSGDAFSIVGWLDKPIDQDALERALNSAVTKFHGKKPRILHVEDDADILHLTSALLGDAANVTAVTTQQAARRLLKEQNFDLVILDLMLPDGPGEELLPSLHKADGSAIPVIVFSAKEPSQATARSVVATLVKSQASMATLLKVVQAQVEEIKRTQPGQHRAA